MLTKLTHPRTKPSLKTRLTLMTMKTVVHLNQWILKIGVSGFPSISSTCGCHSEHMVKRLVQVHTF